MATTKDKFAVVFGTAALMTGAMTFLQPSRDPQQRARDQTQNQVEDLADSHDKELQRYRDEGNAHGDAENARRLIPGEYRPPEPHIRIRVIP